MKTEYASNQKDNVAAATVLTATFIAIMVSLFASNDARADKVLQPMEVQRMETMVITAPRIQQVVRLETVVVTASRHTEQATKFLIASN